MKNGKKLALALGLAAGAVLAVVATKSTRKTKQHISKSATTDKLVDSELDNEVHYI
ncbi:MAG: hypothetical protein ABJH05_06465 [Fulvivirga sp.]